MTFELNWKFFFYFNGFFKSAKIDVQKVISGFPVLGLVTAHVSLHKTLIIIKKTVA